jgi:hypothetical protein
MGPATHSAQETADVAAHLAHDGRRLFWMTIFQGLLQRLRPWFLKVGDLSRLLGRFQYFQCAIDDPHLLCRITRPAEDVTKGEFYSQGARDADSFSPKGHIGN